MEKKNRERYLEYRNTVWEILKLSKDYINPIEIQESIDYFDHWEHALAFDSLLFYINWLDTVDHRLIKNIEKALLNITPDWTYLTEESVKCFLDKFK